MGLLVYFSSKSQNTHRFVDKLNIPAQRIPISPQDDMPEIHEPYVLVVPTYADGDGKGAIPKQVIHFLNDETNRSYLRGVIAGGNRNFGQFYAYAGDIISARCKVPCLYRFELMGTAEDVANVRNGINKLWK
ncbi:MAG TPA: class Ib ribonucleoside-diphosphate reductase assembly flavoprotein NrdI [Rhodospirillaceae bacterium]|nr:class Ib ribonucleoside-diphosphate reductase assembly flavoprotein NrdI [Rhodospirillaceae bacterium]